MDRVSVEKRSANMRAVKAKNTTPEIFVRKASHKLGLRFRIHRADLPGCPDIVFPKHKTVIFVNGCFWHGHAGCRRASLPKSNSAFWKAKIGRNRARDRSVREKLGALGWRVVTIWQCEVPNDAAAMSRVASVILKPT